MRNQVQSLDPETRTKLASEVAQQIIATSEWKQSNRILLFASLPDEIDTSLLIEQALQSGKIAYLPVVKGDQLELYRFHPGMNRIGAFGITEPDPKASELLTDCSLLDLAIIPGRAFTPGGLRLGRGKGYYDRLLHNRSWLAWGIAFPCQLVPTLPTDPWDEKLDRVFAGPCRLNDQT